MKNQDRVSLFLEIALLALILSQTAVAQRPPVIVPPPPPPQSAVVGAPAGGEVIVPEGTVVQFRMAEYVSTKINEVDDPFRAVLDRDIVVNDQVVLAKGTELEGRLLYVRRAGKVKGRARLELAIERVFLGQEAYEVKTSPVTFEASGSKNSDTKKVGGGAILGAIIGAITGGGKGAAVGAAAGAGAGTAGVLLTRGKEVELEKEHLLSARLEETLVIAPGNP